MRVLFSCIPSEGHFSPLLPLARALASRGHDVAFAVAESWCFRAGEEGFESLAAGPDAKDVHHRFEPQRREIFALPPEQRRPLRFSGLFGRMHAPEKLPQLLPAAREWGADAIVFDSADLAAPLAAAVLGVPSVNHSFGAMIPFAALERAAAVVEPLSREHGLEPDPHAGAFRGLFVDLAPESRRLARRLRHHAGRARARTAARAPPAGRGPVRQRDLTVRALRSALARVLDDRSLADGAGWIAAEIEVMGTPDEVAAAVEEHAARR